MIVIVKNANRQVLVMNFDHFSPNYAKICLPRILPADQHPTKRPNNRSSFSPELGGSRVIQEMQFLDSFKRIWMSTGLKCRIKRCFLPGTWLRQNVNFSYGPQIPSSKLNIDSTSPMHLLFHSQSLLEALQAVGYVHYWAFLRAILEAF